MIALLALAVGGWLLWRASAQRSGWPLPSDSTPVGGLLRRAVEEGVVEPVQWTSVDFDGYRVRVGNHALGVRFGDTYVRLPATFRDSIAIAREKGWVLPTASLVDAIWRAAPVKIDPQRIIQPADAGMTSFGAARRASSAINFAVGARWDALAAPEGKSWILSPRNTVRPGFVATYGMHRPNGTPIQPAGPSSAAPPHNDAYTDYSQVFVPIKRRATRLSDNAVVDLLDVFEQQGLPSAATAPLR